MTDFIRNAKSYVAKVKETKNPIAITVNGEAEVVIVDAAEYQALVDESENARFVSAIKEGLADVQAGRTLTLAEVRERMSAKYGV